MSSLQPITLFYPQSSELVQLRQITIKAQKTDDYKTPKAERSQHSDKCKPSTKVIPLAFK